MASLVWPPVRRRVSERTHCNMHKIRSSPDPKNTASFRVPEMLSDNRVLPEDFWAGNKEKMRKTHAATPIKKPMAERLKTMEIGKWA